MPKTKIVYEVRDPERPRWREIEAPSPNSLVGVNVRRPGDTWADEHGWEYRAREVPAK